MATGIKQQDRQDTIAGWLFMSPTLVILGIFMALPILFALLFSFTDWNGISPPQDAQWIGLANFQELLLQDGIRRADFFKSLKNTFYFSLGVVPLQTIISLALAVVINQRRLRLKDFFRTPPCPTRAKYLLAARAYGPVLRAADPDRAGLYLPLHPGDCDQLQDLARDRRQSGQPYSADLHA